MSLCTRDTDRSPLSLTGRGALCLHTELHVPAELLGNRGYPAAIVAAGHAHRDPSKAAGVRPLAALKDRTSCDVLSEQLPPSIDGGW